MKKVNKKKTKKRERKNMCKRIRDIQKMSPVEIRDKYWNSQLSPLNMLSLLENMNISCIAVDFSSLEYELKQKKGNIHGLAYSDKDELGIFYHADSPKDANYILAHELAHCCLHLPVSTEFHVELNADEDIYEPLHRNGFWKKLNESEADAFAADLLIPTNSLLIQLAENEKPTIEILSEYFNAPEKLIHLKLNMLVE